MPSSVSGGLPNDSQRPTHLILILISIFSSTLQSNRPYSPLFLQLRRKGCVGLSAARRRALRLLKWSHVSPFPCPAVDVGRIRLPATIPMLAEHLEVVTIKFPILLNELHDFSPALPARSVCHAADRGLRSRTTTRNLSPATRSASCSYLSPGWFTFRPSPSGVGWRPFKVVVLPDFRSLHLVWSKNSSCRLPHA
jgi:hypothetical protein